MITFENLNNGELAEKFRMALAQIGYNIMDPNMDPDASRGMTINITFKPAGSGVLTAKCDVKTKLAGFSKSATTLLIGQDIRTGKIEIKEHGSRESATQISGVSYSVQAETIPPQRPVQQPETFDQETGEIYEPLHKGPIDLRAARQ